MKFQFQDKVLVNKGFYKTAQGTVVGFFWFFGMIYIIELIYEQRTARIRENRLDLLATRGLCEV